MSNLYKDAMKVDILAVYLANCGIGKSAEDGEIRSAAKYQLYCVESGESRWSDATTKEIGALKRFVAKYC